MRRSQEKRVTSREEQRQLYQFLHRFARPHLGIFVATAVKRLHDRDKSAWWMVPFFLLPNLYNHFSDLLPDSYFMLIPSLIMFVLMMWGFVELYFLRGSRKTNRFGPNPLLAVTPERRWDQNSEIEMVPHKANAHFPKFAIPGGGLARNSGN